MAGPSRNGFAQQDLRSTFNEGGGGEGNLAKAWRSCEGTSRSDFPVYLRKPFDLGFAMLDRLALMTMTFPCLFRPGRDKYKRSAPRTPPLKSTRTKSAKDKSLALAELIASVISLNTRSVLSVWTLSTSTAVIYTKIPP